MRILYTVHQFFPNHYTGTERLVLNLCKQMQRMGHSVKVLTYGITDTEGFVHEGGFLFKEYIFQGVPVISFRHKKIPEDLSFSIFDVKMTEMLEKKISRDNFDAIHICHPMRMGSIVKAFEHTRIPVILTLTDFWLMCPKGIAVTQEGELCQTSDNGIKCINECYGDIWKDRIIQRNNECKVLLQSVDAIVSATNFLKQIFQINNSITNIKLIKFGKDYSNIRANLRTYTEENEICLGFLSTLLLHKGAHVLLEAFNEANRDNLRLKIYGHYFNQTDYYNRLKKIANNNNKIEFLGEYRYEEMSDIMDGIDVLVVPSVWWENSPLILLRALAHKVPAIVSNLGGLTEIIKEGENGFSFEAGNPKSLAAVLKRIGDHPTILNEIKNKIRHPPRIEEEAFEYEQLYMNLISNFQKGK